jgi:RNA polymerase sigma-B factor
MRPDDSTTHDTTPDEPTPDDTGPDDVQVVETDEPGPARRASDAADADTCRRLDEAAHGSPLERLVLQNGVVTEYAPMARRLARRYEGRGVESDDLEQVARLGLVKAVRRFDPSRRSFAAYAVPTVLGELRRHFRDKAWAIRPTRSVQELQASVTAARDAVREQEQHPATDEEVAERLGVDVAEVRGADAAHDAFAPRSLDRPSPVDGLPGHEHVGDDDDAFDAVDRLQSAAPALRSLSDQDRHLLELRFGADMTQREIGAELGISQMQVSRRLATVLQRVRDRMGDTRD